MWCIKNQHNRLWSTLKFDQLVRYVPFFFSLKTSKMSLLMGIIKVNFCFIFVLDFYSFNWIIFSKIMFFTRRIKLFVLFTVVDEMIKLGILDLKGVLVKYYFGLDFIRNTMLYLAFMPIFYLNRFLIVLITYWLDKVPYRLFIWCLIHPTWNEERPQAYTNA